MGSLLAALGIVFVAELGDKTQLVALGLGTRHRLAPVLIGIAVGYAAVNLVSVSVGALLGTAFPSRAVGLVGGLLFLGFAVANLLARDPPIDSAAVGLEPVGFDRSVVWSSAAAIFVAELGDKTMLVTATLAADGDPVLVWIGATLGIALSGALGVMVGRAIGRQLPARFTRLLAAALFAGFGIFLVATNL